MIKMIKRQSFALTFCCLIFDCVSAKAFSQQVAEPEMEVNFLLLGQSHFTKNKSQGEGNNLSGKGQRSFLKNKPSSKPAKTPSYAFSVQKLEFLLKSDIEPYFRGELSLGLHWHLSHSNWGLDLEELFIESLQLPLWGHLKAGKFHALMGRHNHLHQHDRPFVDPPLPHYHILGREPFRGNGIALSFAPSIGIWHPQAILQVFHFGRDIPSNLFSLKNVLDFNPNSYLELDLSYGTKIKPTPYDQCSLSNNPTPPLQSSKLPPMFAQRQQRCPTETHIKVIGGMVPLETLTYLYNIALNYKYKNFLGQKHGLEWTTEFISGRRDGAKESGFSSWIEMGFLKHWIGKARFGYYRGRAQRNRQYSALVAFAPTEHSSLRLQYNLLNTVGKSSWNHSLFIQANMSIGTHSSHEESELD